MKKSTDFLQDAIDVQDEIGGYGTIHKTVTGLKFDDGKPLMGLIPPIAELEMARVLTFGASKYGRENWRHVDGASDRYLDAMMRHINSYRQGEQNDPESGISHLAHVMCCAAFLIEASISQSKKNNAGKQS